LYGAVGGLRGPTRFNPDFEVARISLGWLGFETQSQKFLFPLYLSAAVE